jgi:hypothetical protein
MKSKTATRIKLQTFFAVILLTSVTALGICPPYLVEGQGLQECSFDIRSAYPSEFGL